MQEEDASEDLYTSATLQAMFPRARVQKTLDAVEMACPSAKLSHLVTVLRAVAAKLFRAMDANLSEFATQLGRDPDPSLCGARRRGLRTATGHRRGSPARVPRAVSSAAEQGRPGHATRRPTRAQQVAPPRPKTSAGFSRAAATDAMAFVKSHWRDRRGKGTSLPPP